MKTLLMALALVFSSTAFANELSFEEMASADFSVDSALSDSPLADLDRDDRDRDGRDRDDRFDRPGRDRRVQCLAVNGRGMRFVGHGFNRNRAANQALNRCYRFGSRRCEVRVCRVDRGRFGDR